MQHRPEACQQTWMRRTGKNATKCRVGGREKGPHGTEYMTLATEHSERYLRREGENTAESKKEKLLASCMDAGLRANRLRCRASAGRRVDGAEVKIMTVHYGGQQDPSFLLFLHILRLNSASRSLL